MLKTGFKDIFGISQNLNLYCNINEGLFLDFKIHCLKFICKLHGPSMLTDKAEFVECSIISLALSLWVKDLVTGQLQKPAKFSDFHWSPS